MLFDFSTPNGGHVNDVMDFMAFLQNTVRETDTIGYLSEGTIGLLLANTGAEGCKQLVRKVTSSCRRFSLTVRSATYPDQLFDEFPEDAEDSQQLPPLFLDDSTPSRRFRYAVKRVIDISVSLIGLVLLSPLMFLTAVAIKVDSPGPVIFRQIRAGKRGAPFVFYKFRSMRSNSDDQIHREYVTKLIQGGREQINFGDEKRPLYKIKVDPRVTRVGRVIRKLSIDELPQLFNVLKGEMSLVGPRPPLPYETEKYQSWHLRRISEMKPGITGMWQVSGRSSTTFDDMVRLDVQYIQNWSLLLDVKILLKTVKVVLKPQDAF